MSAIKKLSRKMRFPHTAGLCAPGTIWKRTTPWFAGSLILAVSLSIIRCASLKDLVQKPTIEFKRVRPDRLSFTEGTFVFQFHTVNPNPVSLSIREIAYELRLNERRFIEGVLQEGIRLPANGASDFDLPVTISYFDFFRSIQDFVRMDSIRYTLSGSVPIGPFRIPFETTGRLSRPDLPEVRIESIRITGLSLRRASLILNLSWLNPNDYPLPFNGYDIHLKLNDMSVLKGTFEKTGTVEKGDALSLSLPFTIDFLEAGQSVYELLRTGSIAYVFEGRLNIAGSGESAIPVPFEKRGEVSITR